MVNRRKVVCESCKAAMRLHCGSPTCSWHLCSPCRTVFDSRTVRLFHPQEWTYR